MNNEDTDGFNDPHAHAARPSAWRGIALGMLGLFIGALTFILGIGVGAVMARPGGLLAAGGTLAQNLPGLTASSAAENNSGAPGTHINQGLVDEVLRRVNNEWYGDVPANDKLTDGAIRGMVSSLGDPFTQYVEPSLAKIMEQDSAGKFEGIGASLRPAQGGGIQIVRVFRDSPAEKAGVLANDVIDSVDGRAVSGLGTNEVAALVRGKKGTTVKLMLRRGSAPRPFEIEVTRGEIVIPLVTSKMLGPAGDIAYVSLYDFSAQANRQLTDDLSALLAKKPRALILDLRDNPGGLLSQAVDIGDIFLKKGPFVIERDDKGVKKVTDTTDRGIAQDIPMAVLVNGGSASASEIVAGALQDYDRAKLFGELTYGKGSVQSPQTLPNGAQLRITIEHWFTPKDRAIHHTGIKPDYVVAPAATPLATPLKDPAKPESADTQLDAAVAYLDTGALPVKP